MIKYEHTLHNAVDRPVDLNDVPLPTMWKTKTCFNLPCEKQKLLQSKINLIEFGESLVNNQRENKKHCTHTKRL